VLLNSQSHSFTNTCIAAEVENLFCALNGKGSISSYLPCQLLSASLKSIFVRENIIDKPHILSLKRGIIARRIGHFSGKSLADYQRKPLKHAHIGNQSDVGLFKTKDCIFSAEANITGGNYIKPAADTFTMYSRDDRFGTLFN